jgi:hypothetical protein
MKNIFNKYKVVKNAITRDLANFIFNYFLIKNSAVSYMYANNICEQSDILGSWKDPQSLNTYSCYADFATEALLIKIMPVMKKYTGLDLVPTYSYMRLYKNGDELKRHKDRPCCEISTTLNLGGDSWPIYLEPDSSKGSFKNDEQNVIYTASNSKGIKIDLKQGDMLIYSGCELEHWREPFKGFVCGQVFLHYNNVKGKFTNTNKFDKRPMLGLPFSTRK